jgi:hypothetical protein
MAYKNPNEWPAEAGMTFESLNVPLNQDMTNFKTSILNAIMRNNTILTSKAWRSLPNDQKDELIKNALIEVATTTPRLGTMGFTRAIQNNYNAFKTNASNASNAFKPSTWSFSRNSQGGRKMRKTLNKKKGKKMKRTLNKKKGKKMQRTHRKH